MFPIVLDTEKVRFILIGSGKPAENRLQKLRESGAAHITLFSGGQNLPGIDDIKKAHIVYVTGLPGEEAEKIAQLCRRAGVLVNVEDTPPLCDFHTPSIVRRGDLVLSVSTGGKSPGLAKRLHGYLEDLFEPDWDKRLEILAGKRKRWRDEQYDMKAVAQKTKNFIDEKKWLK